ncbi:MAG: hypothetical protein IJB59_03775, partial [Oscillospiraceae bacterium]|nr:hypothetical protein [Oscillospiraceae bacterium]
AHNLFAYGEQIPHLQPEKYFLPGTRPGRKYFSLYFPLARKTLRGFFDGLRRGAAPPFVFPGQRQFFKARLVRFQKFATSYCTSGLFLL